MSRPDYTRASSNVDDWLEGQFEYMVPDRDINDPCKPRDTARDTTPDRSDVSPPRSKGSRSSRDHRGSKDRYRPVTPPEEEALNRERDRDRHTRRTSHSRDNDRETRRAHHDKDIRYPPKSERGRPRRPPLTSRTTAPYESRKQDSPERRLHRRYSVSSSPPRQRGDKSSRHHHRSRKDRSPSPPSQSSRNRDDRDWEVRRHRNGSVACNKDTKSRRPSLSRTPSTKDGKKPSISGRAFGFWNDPRFKSAAEAALTAGATVAVGLAGEKGGFDKAKVIRAGLGAAAMSAIKTPAPTPQPAPAAAPASEPRPSAADAAGRYMADHIGRKSSTRRRHH